MTDKLKSVAILEAGCTVTLLDGTLPDGREIGPLPFLWLRDHCQCADCLHPETRQRLMDSFSIPADIRPRSATIVDDGTALEIVWEPDGHISRFASDFLAQMMPEAESDPLADPNMGRVLWDAATLARGLPQVTCSALMAEEAGLREALTQLDRYGFIFVKGVEPTPEATEAVARRIAYIRETIFGGFWDFTANMEHKDTAYTSLALGLHTDGTYSFDAPGYQMFHCLAFDGTGGESLLVDGFRVAEDLRAAAPDLYRVLTEIDVPGQYIDQARGIHLVARLPILRLDRSGRLVQIRYNNHDRAPFLLDADRMAAFYRGLAAFNERLNDPAYQLRKRLEPGEMLIFDNWRALHGRAAYQGFRRLAGAYLNKEDVESRLRVMRAG
ncbi:MAG TPA: trimethyllysine dioxygenase [Ferrovibrio sp.]|uniref:trimethyllysine dioxygenase n=1 Tax=Ferrovibrio sp. TaxID=1917215 RepID=UPI002ED294D9